MYHHPLYKEQDETVINEFIAQNPFALLTGCDSENRPVATQVPIFIEERNNKKVLRGHIMKNTDHYNALLQNQNVLTVFNGKHSYISATWYSNPHAASTWNYMSVHIKGIIKFLDYSDLEDILRKTTLHFENQNQESTTVYDNIPLAYKERLMHAIAAFEIEITDIDTIFKLSQDKDEESYTNIISKLKEQNPDAKSIAAEMEKRAHDLFTKS